MRKELWDILDIHRSALVKQLDIDGGILNRLLSKEVITVDHMEDIKVICLSSLEFWLSYFIVVLGYNVIDHLCSCSVFKFKIACVNNL